MGDLTSCWDKIDKMFVLVMTKDLASVLKNSNFGVDLWCSDFGIR